MGSVREHLLVVVFLVVGFLAAGPIIDRIPLLAQQSQWSRFVFSCVFSLVVFVALVFALAIFMKCAAMIRPRKPDSAQEERPRNKTG